MDRKWWTLLVVCVATFMLLLDITVVNVALPAIQKDLDASFSDIQWVIDAYALTLASLLLTAGTLGDLLGRRKVFAAGMVVFCGASLACGLSGSPIVLEISRGVQGIGGSTMFALTLALLAQEFHGRERGTALGIWGATTGAAVAIGPLVGGALVDGFGWEWIFFVNVPVGVAALTILFTRVRETADPTGARIDYAGTITFSASLFALVLGLVRANAEGWGSTLIVSLFVASAVLMLAFVLIERRVEHPMFELSLFRKPAFIGADAAAFCLSASMFAMFLYLTLYIQNVLGYTPLQAGVRFLPVTLVSFVAAAASGNLTSIIPARFLLALGLGLVGVGLWLMHGVTPADSWTTLLPGFLVAGAGIGLTNPAIASSAIGVVPPQRSGMASGINTTFRQVGIATGIAALGAVFQSQVQSHLATSLKQLPGGILHPLSEAVATIGPKAAARAPAAQRHAVADAARSAFIGGLNDILVIAFIVAFAGALLALLLVRQSDFVQSAPQAEPVAAA
ncbi:MAG TPA: MFS transporter [Thermoleophilaceae bacterium]|nr:MFS transporter [Thermoleophilaceae bacterium]